ncbi:carbohydrate sulfotransferase 11-like isoform X2 [Apostichopus japonicus]|uniref:carbohydrate sulfotransferase 11-like isoform X2 n=1 Tax=Stichopus japonicus TaxID=307972 RepID=UPI003AB1C6BE
MKVRRVRSTSMNRVTEKQIQNLTHTADEVMEFLMSMNISLDSFLSKDYSLKEEKWLALMEARQRSRVQRMNFFCDSYHIRKRTTRELLAKQSYRHALYANDQNKVIFSLVLKVASNHFKKLFKQIGGSKRLYIMPTESCKGRVENYFRILFVRHPLARMLSAYKEKFVEHHIAHFVQIGRKIIGDQREGATQLEIKQATDVTFLEFIKHLTMGKKARINTHWDLIWIHNRVCEMRYDFIGKLETIEDDYRYMLYKMSRGRLHASDYNFMGAYRSYHGNDEKLQEYYQQVPSSVLQLWYNIYRRDFELFGYNMDIINTTHPS